jgi:hypothetical protein
MHRYSKKLRNFLPTSQSTKWLLLISIALVPSIFLSKSFAQSLTESQEKRIGLIFEGVRSFNGVRLTSVNYTGECSGRDDPTIQTWFTSTTTPPAPGRRVIVRNVTTGIRPDKQPYTDREYDEGTVSEGFTVEFGTEHSGQRFRVLDGPNELEYEIKEKKNVIESGTFTANFEKDVQTRERNAESNTQKVCANSYVALNVCADIRNVTRWTCPGGKVIAQQQTPEGPVRTRISNQTFSPVSYEIGGRIYRLEPGQDHWLRGNNLSQVRVIDNSHSEETNSYQLTPGTNYRFTNTSGGLSLSQWYNR